MKRVFSERIEDMDDIEELKAELENEFEHVICTTIDKGDPDYDAIVALLKKSETEGLDEKDVTEFERLMRNKQN